MNTIKTERLLLRAFELRDAEIVDNLMNDISIAKNLYNIQWPYLEGYGREWITKGNTSIQDKELIRYAIELHDSSQVIGMIELRLSQKHNRGEIGYWIGANYRKKGYCKEAINSLLELSFNSLSLHRVEAFCFSDNINSIKLLEMIGFKREGAFREDSYILGEYKNSIIFGMLKSEYNTE